MLAHKLGVKTCIGTETPLTIPAAVREHLKQLGKDPADPAVVRELYDGIFKRIAATLSAGLLLALDARGLDLGRQQAGAVRGHGPRHPRRLRRCGKRQAATGTRKTEPLVPGCTAGHLRLGAGAATRPRGPGQPCCPRNAR